MPGELQTNRTPSRIDSTTEWMGLGDVGPRADQPERHERGEEGRGVEQEGDADAGRCIAAGRRPPTRR